jgi:hypothetical protein
MTDEWNERLPSPNCGKTGMASLSQGDADAPTVHSVPDGFKVVAAPYGPDFHCTTCNVGVCHKPVSVGGLPRAALHWR